MKRIAVLAPALPTVSATFVHRELAAMESLGCTVSAHSLRRGDDGSPEGRAHAARTEVLYGAPLRLVADALEAAVTAPLGTLRAAARAARDLASGTFDRRGQRARIPVQLVAGLALGRRLRRAGAGHLHVHFAHAPATVGMYAAAAAGVSLSVVGHARDLLVEGGLLERKLARAELFTTVSWANRVALHRRFGEAANRVVVQRCGVDRGSFRPASEGAEPRGFHVGAVARLVPKKGFDLLLVAMAQLRKSLPGARLTIVGDGPERARLEELRGDLGLEGHVVFAGAGDAAAVRDLLGSIDAFCLPCRRAKDGDRDGVPVALMEAMASGVPVVAGQVPGLEELVREQVNGRLVDAEDTAQLSGALAELGAGPEPRGRFRRRALETIAKHYDLHRNTAQLVARIDGLQRGRSAAPALLRG